MLTLRPQPLIAVAAGSLSLLACLLLATACGGSGRSEGIWEKNQREQRLNSIAAWYAPLPLWPHSLASYPGTTLDEGARAALEAKLKALSFPMAKEAMWAALGLRNYHLTPRLNALASGTVWEEYDLGAGWRLVARTLLRDDRDNETVYDGCGVLR